MKPFFQSLLTNWKIFLEGGNEYNCSERPCLAKGTCSCKSVMLNLFFLAVRGTSKLFWLGYGVQSNDRIRIRIKLEPKFATECSLRTSSHSLVVRFNYQISWGFYQYNITKPHRPDLCRNSIVLATAWAKKREKKKFWIASVQFPRATQVTLCPGTFAAAFKGFYSPFFQTLTSVIPLVPLDVAYMRRGLRSAMKPPVPEYSYSTTLVSEPEPLYRHKSSTKRKRRPPDRKSVV